MNSDRFVRQADFVPRDELTDCSVTVIGVGAIGRQAALMLAAIGAAKLRLVDYDEVEATNVVTQGYSFDDLGRPKVEVLRDELRSVNPEADIAMDRRAFDPQGHIRDGEAYFLCVDSIETREQIWRAAKESFAFLVDGRMLGETMQVLAVHSGSSKRERDIYDASFFKESEAATGRCTSQSTVYSAAIAAGLMVHQFTRWLRELPLEPRMMLDLMSAEYLPLDTGAEAEEPAVS